MGRVLQLVIRVDCIKRPYSFTKFYRPFMEVNEVRKLLLTVSYTKLIRFLKSKEMRLFWPTNKIFRLFRGPRVGNYGIRFLCKIIFYTF